MTDYWAAETEKQKNEQMGNGNTLAKYVSCKYTGANSQEELMFETKYPIKNMCHRFNYSHLPNSLIWYSQEDVRI